MSLEFDAATHTYTLNGRRIPSVTQILAQVVDYSMVPADILDRKCAIGSALHQAIAYDHDGALDEDSIDAAVLPYFDAWRKFVFDMGGALVVHAAEKPFASTLYQYGTTPDIWGTVGGHFAVIELKSTATIHPAVGLQTAAQAEALTDNLVWTGKAFDAIQRRSVKRFCLQLKPTGNYTVREFKERSDFAVFIALRSVWGWKAANNLGEKS